MIGPVFGALVLLVALLVFAAVAVALAAPVLGTGGSVTLDTTLTTLFDALQNGGPCSQYTLINNGSANSFKGQVVGMHIDNTSAGGTDGMFTIPPGGSLTLSWSSDRIDAIKGKAAAGTTVVTGFVAGKGD